MHQAVNIFKLSRYRLYSMLTLIKWSWNVGLIGTYFTLVFGKTDNVQFPTHYRNITFLGMHVALPKTEVDGKILPEYFGSCNRLYYIKFGWRISECILEATPSYPYHTSQRYIEYLTVSKHARLRRDTRACSQRHPFRFLRPCYSEGNGKRIEARLDEIDISWSENFSRKLYACR